jgi:hypothetical protein
MRISFLCLIESAVYLAIAHNQKSIGCGGIDQIQRKIESAGSRSQPIARAIDELKGNITRLLRMDDLAPMPIRAHRFSPSLPSVDGPEPAAVLKMAASGRSATVDARGAFHLS